MTEQNILTIEKRLGYTFRDRSLLIQAFTRPSYVNEKKETQIQSNQVLEFFGDSVLSCALVTLMEREFGERYQYGVKTKFNEGDFSVMKSHLSDKTNLSKTTATLGFGAYLLMGEGDHKLGINQEPSVLEDLYESIIGAVWIDSQYSIEAVLGVVEKTLDFQAIAEYMLKPKQSPKNQLQEFCDSKKHRLPTPRYRELYHTGEEHNPTYFVECRVGEYVVEGKGKNKQKAETAAAEALLIELLTLEKQGALSQVSAPKTEEHSPDTPVQQLKRYADREDIEVEYTAPTPLPTEEKGHLHFTCTCTCKSFITEGIARSKQDAKQDAARKMLEFLGLC